MKPRETVTLSDGQIVELVLETYSDKGDLYLIRPINYKSDAPKEIWVDVLIGVSYLEQERGKMPSEKVARLVKYVLAEEPKEMNHGTDAAAYLGKKQPREWWQVRYKRPTDRIYCSVETREQAEDIARKESDEAFRQFEIVHVREVLDEGPKEEFLIYLDSKGELVKLHRRKLTGSWHPVFKHPDGREEAICIRVKEAK